MDRFEIDLESLRLRVDHGEDYVRLDWSEPVETLSSALYGGGRQRLSHLLNLQVQHNEADHYGGFEPPERTLEAKAERLGIGGPFAGMMTSASMKSFRWHIRREGGLSVFCCLTAGVTNARAAGDPADFSELEAHQACSGTINLAVGTNASLSEAALAEALMVAAEARAAAVARCGVKSPVSGRTATGTGTDSILVFSGGGPDIRFCGKHTLMGEMLAEAVITPLTEVIRLIQDMEARGLI